MSEIKLVHLCKIACEQNASDLHLNIGIPPILRIAGKLYKINLPILNSRLNYNLIYSILTDQQKAQYEKNKDLDFIFSFPEIGRFRANIFFKEGGYCGVFRVIESTIRPFSEMNLSKDLLESLAVSKGLVLVTGSSGSGKTSTINAIVDYMNKTQSFHIITIEQPIEYIHKHQKSIVTQREIGTHAISFQQALKNTMREDANVVFIGEIRDKETMQIVLTATEIGFLVLSTLSTLDAVSTVTRIIDMFSGEQKKEIRIQLSLTLKAIISQKLILSATEKKKRVCASELMINNSAIANLIRDGHLNQILHIIETSPREGMISMKKSIQNLLNRNMIEKKDV